MRDGRLYAPIALLAISAGFAVSRASAAATLFVVGISLLLALIWGVRILTMRVPRTTGFPVEPTPDDGRFAAPRRLVYVGLAMSCLLRVRVHGLTVSDAVFALALLWAALEYLAGNERESILPQAVWVGIFLFVVGATASTVAHSRDVASSVGIILRVFYLVAAWLWLGGLCLRTRAHVWTALKCWVASAALCGAWAVGQRFAHLPGGVDAGRFAGLTDHVNDFGALTACAVVPALALAYRARLWIAPAVFIVGGLALSGSVGAGIAALLSLAVGLTSRELTRPTLVALVVGGLVLVVAGPLLGSTAIARFSTTTNSSAQFGQDTFDTRIRTYATAWRTIEHNPILGTGLDVASSDIYDPNTGTYYQVHNLFLGVLYEAGILGVAGIITVLAAFVRAAWALVRSSPDRYLAMALFAGLVAYIGTEMSEPSLYKRYSLVPVFLITALRALTHRLSFARVFDRASTPMARDHAPPTPSATPVPTGR